ncbi:MAG TPA: hypothetical protein VF981_16805 [Gemmatimonadaceae bacterium]
MSGAVAAFDAYRAGPDHWALGRFVVPIGRVAELVAAVRSLSLLDRSLPWPVSVVAGPEVAADGAALSALRDAHRGVVLMDSVESRASTPHEATTSGELVKAGFEVFVELAPTGNLEPLMDAISLAGAAAKLRTGGTAPDAFPAPTAVLRFLRAAHRAGVRCKATAGLHHPVRGEFPLTYEPHSPRGMMYGYLNLLLAAALVFDDRDDDAVLAVLQEENRDAFTIAGETLEWRDERFPLALIDAVRSRFITGFGSCSFREPLDEVPPRLVHA